MLSLVFALGMTGAVVLLLVTIPATREGRGPWTWWAHKRAERAQRLLDRPVPTAEERFARGFSLRRLLGVVLHALPRRRRRSVPRFVTPGERTSEPRTQSAAAGNHAPAVTTGAAAPAAPTEASEATEASERVELTHATDSTDSTEKEPVQPAPRPRRGKVEGLPVVAQVEAHRIAGEESDEAGGDVVVLVKKEIPRPQVIEADPIDTDIVNPRILARS